MSVPARLGGSALGALWYKSVLQSSQCPNGDHPSGFQLGQDVVNWAVVINPGVSTANYILSIFNGGQVINVGGLKNGLNFGQVPVVAGTPSMQLKNGATVVSTASGGRSVSSGCPDGIFNMNYIVVGLK